MKDFEVGILNAQMRQEWKLNLELLVEELEDKAAVGKTLSCVLERETWAVQGELTKWSLHLYAGQDSHSDKTSFGKIVKQP
jgi:hypothetical protein